MSDDAVTDVRMAAMAAARDWAVAHFHLQPDDRTLEPVIAGFAAGVAAGRRQAAEELMSQVGNTTGDQTPDQIRWFALEVLNDIAEGAPAEPVEDTDRG